ncbi:MAG: acetyl-CoA carboxylase carboxyltransferase subunit beta [Eubacteriales bacterium]
MFGFLRKDFATEREKLAFSAGDNKTFCKGCGGEVYDRSLINNFYICPNCSEYHRIPPRDRIAILADSGSFCEVDKNIQAVDSLNFPLYKDKLEKAKSSTGEKEAVICGTMMIKGIDCACFVMDPRFIMASLGAAVGEKITRLFELATEKSLPVLGFTASGGARMQEGILSLMQMAKCSGAVKRHSDAGNLYVVVLTDPTTGGVTASFAMGGDVILAEPKALIGFAGRRVIEQTTGAKLPENFQSAEFMLEHGFIDKIVPRDEQRSIIASLMRVYSYGGRNDGLRKA